MLVGSVKRDSLKTNPVKTLRFYCVPSEMDQETPVKALARRTAELASGL